MPFAEGSGPSLPAETLTYEMRAFIAHSQHFAAADGTLQAHREAYLALCRHYTPVVPADIEIRDIRLAGCAARVYASVGDTPLGGLTTVLYLHGGGWTMGSHGSHDYVALALMARAGLGIVVLDYALAPEHPFPAALHDAARAFQQLRAGTLGELFSTTRLVIAGDSAGGDLAASLCLHLRDHGLPQPNAQILLFPVVTAMIDEGSMVTFAQGPLLSVSGLQASIAAYLPTVAEQLHPHAMPLHSGSHADLAPAFLAVGGCDPLHDQGLRDEGVTVYTHDGDGLVHGALGSVDIRECGSGL